MLSCEQLRIIRLCESLTLFVSSAITGLVNWSKQPRNVDVCFTHIKALAEHTFICITTSSSDDRSRSRHTHGVADVQRGISREPVRLRLRSAILRVLYFWYPLPASQNETVTETLLAHFSCNIQWIAKLIRNDHSLHIWHRGFTVSFQSHFLG